MAASTIQELSPKPKRLRIVPAVQRRSGQRRLLRFTAIAVLTVGLAVLAQAWRYPGFVRGSYLQFRYSTVHENHNLWFCISYWLHFMQKLSFDPKNKVWNFDTTPEAGLDGYEKGRLAFHRGDFSRAVSLIQSEIRNSGESEDRLFWLGMSYMRLGEGENCLSTLKAAGAEGPGETHSHENTARVCALPFTAFHRKPEYSREAARVFEKLLDAYDRSNYLYRWLLNLSYMTIDEFPAGVPERYRIQGAFIDTFYGPKKRKPKSATATSASRKARAGWGSPLSTPGAAWLWKTSPMTARSTS